MTDARWTEVDDDLGAACRHFGRAADLFDEGGFDLDGLAGYKQDMALQHAMQSAHTSLENALVRILEILNEERPTGERWHADLVRRASRPLMTPGRSRPPILTPDVAGDVEETRRFRHRATHNYDDFDPTRAVPSIDAARRLATSLKPSIAAFRTTIDPPPAPLPVA
ncbi:MULTISPECIES: ribonuclease toxin HepT-like protein [Methylobacterium]|uniref:HepT-like domain-containing protein n=1 Tax=Methylobacterium thuringiense TaxID=1003091 RepID=A0ABQ4TKZ5_9HYPH|nr:MULTISPECIES: hypothetical protein [Methylobacterium]TXN19270.1 hypothetical protein FV217_21975 [Methylobacterium sp. WL9]GJE56009.1 hypothetical protein EKPJFOCH_2506 [Methylobacterium thuringiense]